MKEKKYMKALEVHQDKLFGYAEELDDMVERMIDDHVSVCEVVGILESAKAFVFTEVLDKARAKKVNEDILGMLDDLVNED